MIAANLKKDFVAISFVVAIGLYSINDYTTPLGAPFWRLSFAGVLGWTLLLFLFSLIERNWQYTPHNSCNRYILFVLLLLVVGFIPLSAQPYFFPVYVAGDFAGIFMFLAIALLVSVRLAIVSDPRILFLMSTMLLGAALTGLLIGGQFQGERFAGRFDPPHMLLFAACLAFVITASTNKAKIFSIGLIALLFYLAIVSGQRTAPIAYFSVIIFSALAVQGWKRSIFPLLILVGALLTSIAVFQDFFVTELRSMLIEGSADSRYGEILQSGEDQSLQGRLFEAADVLHYAANDGAFQLLFGHGHGAAYLPIFSFPEPNVTDIGRVHNIHIGPFLLLHRYGLFGAAMYLSVALMIASDFFRVSRFRIVLRRPPLSDDFWVALLFLFAVSGSFVNFHLRTVLNDPLVAYALAGYVVTRRRFRVEVTSVRIDGAALPTQTGFQSLPVR